MARTAKKRSDARIPFRVTPMLATLVEKPFDRANWTFEEKYDGIRILAYREGGKVTLISRNGIDRTKDFPEVVKAIAALPVETALLDGEMVIFDAKKISRFQLLQQSKGKPRYAIFDCLYVNGVDLRAQPLSERREILEKFVETGGPLLLSARLSNNGLKAFELAQKKQLEGVVAKNLASRYSERRSHDWLKFKVHQEQEFVIGGYTKPEGSRTHFGALLLGVYDHGKLAYVGKVGTGFNGELLASLHKKMQPLVLKKTAFNTPVDEKYPTFLKPKLVAQISFTEWTEEGRLRHPVFLGLRDDKKAAEVHREGA